jgi:long-chain acyl-CoA synthetase
MEQFSVYSALQEHAFRHPNRKAIVRGEQVVTYAELLNKVTERSGWLLREGLVPGEATGLCIRNEVQHLICAMALLCLATPQVSLGSHETDAAKRAIVSKIGVRQLIVEEPETWMEGAARLILPMARSEATGALPQATESSIFLSQPIDSICVYQNTSGSTNIPKTFGLTLERLLILAARCANDPKERRSLRTGSIEFDAHRLHRICSLIAGNTCIFLLQLNFRELVRLCHSAEVSILHIGAYKLASLIRAERNIHSRLPSGTAVQTGGSRVSGRLRVELKRLVTDNLWVQYATSEVGLISIASPDQHESFPEGVGFPATGVTVEVMGPDGAVVPPGEVGQIRVRKAGMASGYVSEQAGPSNFEDGWFYPRDMVSLRPGEPLIFHGRADDVMILNGINVFPSAIEDVLESHPDVKEALAFPVKSRVHGEIPVAAVVLKADASSRAAPRLLDLCRQALGIRSPREIFVVDQIPRSAAGKPLRRELASCKRGVLDHFDLGGEH